MTGRNPVKPLPHAGIATGRNESGGARNVRESITHRDTEVNLAFLADADGVRLVDLPRLSRGDGSAIDDDQVKGTLVIGSRPFDFIDDAPCLGNIGAAAGSYLPIVKGTVNDPVLPEFMSLTW